MKINCLFPVKLYAILNQLEMSNDWRSRMLHNNYIEAPDDGKTRVVLYSPEIQIFSREIDDKYPRFRLAYHRHGDFLPISNDTFIEMYTYEGKFIKSMKVIDLDGEQSLALQAELMYPLLESFGGYLNSM